MWRRARSEAGCYAWAAFTRCVPAPDLMHPRFRACVPSFPFSDLLQALDSLQPAVLLHHGRQQPCPADPVLGGVEPRPGYVCFGCRAAASGLSQPLTLVFLQLKVSRCGVFGQLASSGGTRNGNHVRVAQNVGQGHLGHGGVMGPRHFSQSPHQLGRTRQVVGGIEGVGRSPGSRNALAPMVSPREESGGEGHGGHYQAPLGGGPRQQGLFGVPAKEAVAHLVDQHWAPRCRSAACHRARS
jgi:hypothetical protein